MFATDEPTPIERKNEIEEVTVTHLDQLAMKITDGGVNVASLDIKSPTPELNPHGGVEMNGPKKMIVEYYE